MELRDVLAKRRMVRAFADTPIGPEARDRIVHALTRAPSAGNSQGFAFVVCDGDDAQRFWAAAWPHEERSGPHAEIVRAPLVIVPCALPEVYLDRYAEPDKGWTDRDPARWPVPYWLVDTAFASMLGLLQAVDEDLGALFFGLTHEAEVRAALAIPETAVPIGAIAIGHPAPDTPSPSLARGKRAGVVHRGRWGREV